MTGTPNTSPHPSRDGVHDSGRNVSGYLLIPSDFHRLFMTSSPGVHPITFNHLQHFHSLFGWEAKHPWLPCLWPHRVEEWRATAYTARFHSPLVKPRMKISLTGLSFKSRFRSRQVSSVHIASRTTIVVRVLAALCCLCFRTNHLYLP